MRIIDSCAAGLAICLTAAAHAAPTPCVNDAGLSLPRGFCATVFADGLGHPRHLTVADNGVVYVDTWGRHGSDPAVADGTPYPPVDAPAGARRHSLSHR